MPTCPKCHAVVFSGDIFCGVCGSSIPAPIASAQRLCPKCNTQATIDDEFCGNCGSPLAKASTKPTKSCVKCGTSLDLEDTFCGVCGERSDIIDPNSSGTIAIKAPSLQQPLQPPAQEMKRNIPSQSQPVGEPPTRTSAQQPQFSYGQKKESRKDNKKSLFLVIGIVIAILLVVFVIIGGVLGYIWYKNNSFGSKIETALSSDKLFSPPGECVADIVAEEKTKDPQGTKISEYAPKIIAKVEPPAEQILQNWYKDSDKSTNWNELEKAYSLLTNISPENKDYAAKYFYVLGQKAINSNDFDKAREYYLKAIEKSPDWALPLNGLGKIYIRDDSPFKDEFKAIGYYEKAVQVDPKFTWANVNLATYYRQKGKLTVAKDYMQNAINSYPTKTSLFISMGNICIKLGNYYEADWYFKKALEYETDESAKEDIRKAIRALGQSEESNQ